MQNAGGRLRASDIHLEQGIGGAIIFDQTNSNDAAMDKDQIKGSPEQVKGAVKETAGRSSATRSCKPKAKPTSPKRDRRIEKVYYAVSSEQFCTDASGQRAQPSRSRAHL